MNLIRKISIGRDYKNDAMHYSVGQEVYGGHKICDILGNGLPVAPLVWENIKSTAEKLGIKNLGRFEEAIR